MKTSGRFECPSSLQWIIVSASVCDWQCQSVRWRAEQQAWLMESWVLFPVTVSLLLKRYKLLKELRSTSLGKYSFQTARAKIEILTKSMWNQQSTFAPYFLIQEMQEKRSYPLMLQTQTIAVKHYNGESGYNAEGTWRKESLCLLVWSELTSDGK